MPVYEDCKVTDLIVNRMSGKEVKKENKNPLLHKLLETLNSLGNSVFLSTDMGQRAEVTKMMTGEHYKTLI